MAVSRQQAYVWEQIILKMTFSSNTGAPVVPAEISRVEIQNLSWAVLETITSVTNEGSWVYRITTSNTWNTVAQTVRDVWYYKATVGGIERQAIGQTTIASVMASTPWRLMTASEILAIPLGTDLSGYTEDQINFWSEIATTMIEDYTGRTFGVWTFSEQWETVVDRRGRIIITTKAVPLETVELAQVWVPWSQVIDLNTQYLDIYKEKGYMYYNTQASIGWAMHSAYPSVVLTRADKVSYKISYTTSSSGIPSVVKQALAIIVWNLAKKNKIMQDTGVSGITGSLSSFRSGDYVVNFAKDSTRNNYSPQGRWTDDVLTPDVMEILKRYKFIKQNLY